MPEIGVPVDIHQPDPLIRRAALRRMASPAPMTIEQSPPRTSGNSPRLDVSPIRSASRIENTAMAAAWATPSPGRHSPGS